MSNRFDAGLDRAGEIDRVLSRKEVERLLGISTSGFYRAVRHDIPIVQISKRRIGVRASDLDAWLRRQTHTPSDGG